MMSVFLSHSPILPFSHSPILPFSHSPIPLAPHVSAFAQAERAGREEAVLAADVRGLAAAVVRQMGSSSSSGGGGGGGGGGTTSSSNSIRSSIAEQSSFQLPSPPSQPAASGFSSLGVRIFLVVSGRWWRYGKGKTVVPVQGSGGGDGGAAGAEALPCRHCPSADTLSPSPVLNPLVINREGADSLLMKRPLGSERAARAGAGAGVCTHVARGCLAVRFTQHTTRSFEPKASRHPATGWAHWRVACGCRCLCRPGTSAPETLVFVATVDGWGRSGGSGSAR